jgi:hypothetical protein
MNKLTILFIIASLFILCGFQNSFAKDYYKTYEVVEILENGLTLKNSAGELITVDKKTEGYKVGYDVRYDKIRNRLKEHRWQDYEVINVTKSAITLQHKTGDELSVQGNFYRKYNKGDQVRYDIIDKKIKLSKD